MATNFDDVRRGDLVEAFGGTAEVQRVEANSEGGYFVTLKVAKSDEELQPDVLRVGGPDERPDDADHPARANYLREDEKAEAEADDEESSDKDEDFNL